MAQTQILASGTTSATSTDVVLAAGAVANIIAFTTGSGSPSWSSTGYLTVYIDTNGADQAIAKLTFEQPGVTVQGPGTFRVVRTPQSVALGATSET